MPKKKRFIFVFSVLGAAFLIGVLSFLFATRGELLEKDGVLQNTRVYAEIHIDGDRLRCNVFNHTWKVIKEDSVETPRLQKKVDGKWEADRRKWEGGENETYINKRHDAYGYYPIKPFGEHQEEITLSEVARYPGEYRVLVRIHGEEQDYYAVGYFTIP